MCIDYRGLNLIIKKNIYNLFRIDKLLEGLARVCFFLKLDFGGETWRGLSRFRRNSRFTGLSV